MRAIKLTFALTLVVLPATAQAMSVAEFLAKANALKAKGLMAIGSPDIGLLKTEMETIGAAYRTDVEGARAAGRTPHSCPPPKGSAKAKLGGKAFLADLQAIPPAQARTTSMKDAFYAIMRKRFPC